MQNISDAAIFADSTRAVSKSEERTRSFTLDTTFVSFFLAMDLGQTSFGLDIGSFVSGMTLLAFLVLPYFLFSEGRVGFARWLTGRGMVAVTGAMFGLVLDQAVGTLLPETFRYVPMSLLIVAAIICCNIQIYAILKNRLAS